MRMRLQRLAVIGWALALFVICAIAGPAAAQSATPNPTPTLFGLSTVDIGTNCVRGLQITTPWPRTVATGSTITLQVISTCTGVAIPGTASVWVNQTE